MECLKDFLFPTAFSLYGYIVAVFCAIGVAAFSTSIGIFRIFRSSERRNFHCNVGSSCPFDKNYLQDICFDQYDQQYNMALPLCGFVPLSFIILTLISIVYCWCCVKSRVEEVEQASKIDTENPHPRQIITTRRVFNCYLTQLLVRLILGILFIVLQKVVLYPSGFPTSFVCEMKLTESKVPEANMTFNNSCFTIDCTNSVGSDKDVYAMTACIVNTIFACLVAGEIAYLIRKACLDKTFMNDGEFCQRHLFNRRKTPSRMNEYTMSQRRRISVDTQVLEPLIPPSPGENEGSKNLDDVYVNLIIHTGRWKPDLDMERMDKLRILEEYVKSPKKSIRINKLEELFVPNEDSNDPRKILIIGCPGIGKTLLCKKLLRELSKGEEKQKEPKNFRLLYLFHFRNFNSEEMKSMSLQTLLSRGIYSEGKLDAEIFQFLIEHPDKMLLVFDGLDEFKDHEKCMEEEENHPGNGVTDVMPFAALYVKLVKGKILCGATVLTTTRTYAIGSVEGLKFDRAVEILGFSIEKVKEYCTKFFHDDQSAIERVWQYVQSNLNLLYLCYIPVNCFIVCSLLKKIMELSTSSLQGAVLPTTLTDIYKEALRLFIFKHNPEYQSKTLKRSNLRSNGTFSSSVEETLLKLEALARKGIDEKRMVFELEEVQGMENCGLLNRLQDVENAPFTYKPQFCFIHLTMQEFVAARGIAKMDPQDIQQFISSKAKDEKWHLVIQFVAGLLRGNEAVVNEVFVKNLQDGLLIRSLNRDNRNMALLMMKCLYEANDISSTERAAAELKSNSEFTNQIEFENLSLSPVDCTAIVHFVKHIDNLEYLDVSGNPLGYGGCSELSMLIEAGGPQILYLTCCGISDQGLNKIVDAMKTAETCNLSQLHLDGNPDISHEGYSHLCDALLYEKCKLTGLSITYKLEDESILMKLSNALKHKNCNLTKLHFEDENNRNQDENIYQNLYDALVNDNCKLTDLELNFCYLSSSISHLCEAVKYCKLTNLTLIHSILRDEDISCLCEALKNVNCIFEELHMIGNVHGIYHLSIVNDYNYIINHGLLKNPICQIFISVFNDSLCITDAGVLHLCDALRHKDCKLTKLSLVGPASNSLTKQGIGELQSALTHRNCKIEELTLYCGGGPCLRLRKYTTLPITYKCIDFKIQVHEVTCSIINVKGQHVLAIKGDSDSQYDVIALSSMAFDGNPYKINIERL